MIISINDIFIFITMIKLSEMKNFNIKIKADNSKFNSLDKEFNQLINQSLSDDDNDKKARWETYSVIMDELININEIASFEELKYRLTDGEDINKVMLYVINKHKNSSTLLWFIEKRIMEYIDEDFYNRFFKL